MGIFGKVFSSHAGSATEARPEQAVLIDVRSPAEFAAGHIKDAVPLPLNILVHDIGKVASDKAAPVIVYCQSGARSEAARQQLLSMGYQHVINGGGLHALASRMNREIIR